MALELNPLVPCIILWVNILYVKLFKGHQLVFPRGRMGWFGESWDWNEKDFEILEEPFAE